MAQKIKELEVTKVDFVDRGANPDAHVMLFKRDNFGDDKSGVEPSKANDDDVEKHESALKRFVTAIGKRLGLEPEDINATVNEIAKGDSQSYNEMIEDQNVDAISDQMWNMGYALRSSLLSILTDTNAADKTSAMNESLTQFSSAMQAAIDEWANGKVAVAKSALENVTEDDIRVLSADMQRIESLIQKASPDEPEISPATANVTKGDDDMLDTSKMTPAEKMVYEDLRKRYSTDDATDGGNPVSPETPSITPEAVNVAKSVATSLVQSDDIYAGLHPAVAAEIQMLRKRAEDADNRELTEIAKKYEIIGKKPEELVPVLKSLKAAGGSAYTDMITILDASVEAVNKSALFTEIGKSGSYSTGAENGAWSKIEKKADEIQAQNPKLTRHAAIDMACMQNPDLVHDYENNM